MPDLFIRYHDSPRIAALRRREFYADLFVGFFLVFAVAGAAWLVLR